MYTRGMRPATPIELSTEERRTLETWVRASTTEQRLVLRAQLILAAAAGTATTAIAQGLGVRPATVSQWRRRFAAERLVGLQDRPRPGPPAALRGRDGTAHLGLAGSACPFGLRHLERSFDRPDPEGRVGTSS